MINRIIINVIEVKEMNEELTASTKISNIKKTTDAILMLPEVISFPNGWIMKDLLIHLNSWDDELLKYSQALKKSKDDKFVYDHKKLGMDYSNWNDYIIEKFSYLTFEEAKDLFTNTRKKLIKILEELIEIQKKETDPDKWKKIHSVLDLWQHDKMHLEAGGIAPYL
ncbi:MAG: ClbS/DfsB family four-helix bundle protein [Candidatus Heimdallarchaeota archaeon]|nr:ClbS/DfsB family four-helix bundle protein [Candidatus Heimdallarchaeota archaeon]